MGQLQKSKIKRSALLSATLSLVNNGGIQGASMAKVAKVANVSPATIYLYFENKQDLVNQLYLDVKVSFATAAFEGYEQNITVKKSFERIWYNMSSFKLEHNEEASFLSQCDNTPMIDEKTRQEGLLHMTPLFDLWLRGINEGIIKDISHYLLYAYSIYPMAFLMNMQNRGLCELNDKVLKESFEAAWGSICAKQE
ncbi:TetR/AcrR family transcriptional regulator [Flavobacterium degerlachei]|jgi:AcrR family transcriptional regulator|uniref:Transcriptional regulator, TetR family n=1 Tax=Flavobacterium degerlachei TaxID=229203 RepID=A0A1H3A0M4_9FLAO|nr:TetR/AcrR family transcriptional regulator [Flavobacterium degerlachei]SDX22981.1 transcriptional regulator, TetR family [Flavobacterium degerlachei]